MLHPMPRKSNQHSLLQKEEWLWSTVGVFTHSWVIRIVSSIFKTMMANQVAPEEAYWEGGGGGGGGGMDGYTTTYWLLHTCCHKVGFPTCSVTELDLKLLTMTTAYTFTR